VSEGVGRGEELWGHVCIVVVLIERIEVMEFLIWSE
jgi:hypothetical protein